MGSWQIDTSAWPIVLHTMEGTLSDEELEAWIVEATRVLQRGKPHVTILDAGRVKSFSAYSRMRAAQWQREHAPELRTHCLGTAYVLASPLLRFVVMTVVLVTRLPTPLRVCETTEEALAWARERLAESGHAPP